MQFDDPINESIRSKIRRIRQSKRISVRNAARLSQIPESSYSCLENGFYRISLMNLNKILGGLGATIEEVWPRQQQRRPTRDLAEPEAGSSCLNNFRLLEVHRLSESKKCALFRFDRKLECLGAIGVNPSEKAELAEMIEVGLKRDWTILSRASGGLKIHLCLLQPSLNQHARRVVDVYLDLWLSSSPSPAAGKRREMPWERPEEAAAVASVG